jgi:hypothetical protein
LLFVFRTIHLRAGSVCMTGLFCNHKPPLLSSEILRTLLIQPFTGSELPATMASADFCAVSVILD